MKKKKGKTAKIILLVIVVIAVVIALAASIANSVVRHKLIERTKCYSQVTYEDQLVPVEDANGDYTFTTDKELKVLQLTDVHIGGGWMSYKKDLMSINAVAAMVTAEKPDLVIATGDISYPVPFQAGTFNNKTSADVFIKLMENLGVYWTVCFGNHDTEAYSYYSRDSIGSLYENQDLKYCLFKKGDESVDGVGNQAINVRNSQGKLVQNLYIFDSHSYTDHDYFGIFWKYDNIHQNQVDWYRSKVEAAQKENPEIKSLAFLHIPLVEYRDALNEYMDNGCKDTENVKYNYGYIGEKDPYVFCGMNEDNLFETMLELGSTKGMFCGHDHKNALSLNYKGINLSYGMSVDYLAYVGIYKEGDQRGCTVITVNPDGTYTQTIEGYYQDKYPSVFPKEEVEFGTLDNKIANDK